MVIYDECFLKDIRVFLNGAFLPLTTFKGLWYGVRLTCLIKLLIIEIDYYGQESTPTHAILRLCALSNK